MRSVRVRFSHNACFFFVFFLFIKVKFLAPSFVRPVYDDSPDDP